MQVRLREFRAGDEAFMAALERVCFSDPWTEKEWQESAARKDFFGLVLENKEGALLGYACVYALFESAELLRIAILSEERGKGYGGKLLDGLMETLKTRGAEEMFLEVRAGNLPARRLYESRGFALLRERKKYYADGEDALEMKRSLL